MLSQGGLSEEQSYPISQITCKISLPVYRNCLVMPVTKQNYSNTLFPRCVVFVLVVAVVHVHLFRTVHSLF